MVSQPQSLRVFLSQIIDYAGLYPPANLPLEEAFRNFVSYQDDPEAWMLSHFIIPARRLSELSQVAEQIFPPKGVLSFSALGRSGKNAGDFMDNLELDLLDIANFRNTHGSGILVDMYESILPVSELKNQEPLDHLVQQTASILVKDGMLPFFEAPSSDEWQLQADRLIRSLRAVGDDRVCLKLRTGGVTADAFPACEQIAWAIKASRNAGLTIKATAGMHHPIRRYNESVQTKMHGFINVFGAGILAFVHDLDQDQIQEIIEDENPGNFLFNGSNFSWKNMSVTSELISQARSSGIMSFGSCSFDEPREDLRALGWM